VRRLRLSARRDVRVRGRSPYVADVRRPHTKYAIGTAPSELINDTAAAHFAFEPRTSFDGRRARSTKAAILSAPSIALATTINRRVRGSRSSHFLRPFIRQIVGGDDPGGRFEHEGVALSGSLRAQPILLHTREVPGSIPGAPIRRKPRPGSH
jgi:hypothetical protein